jgi:hypothetical protein
MGYMTVVIYTLHGKESQIWFGYGVDVLSHGFMCWKIGPSCSGAERQWDL